MPHGGIEAFSQGHRPSSYQWARVWRAVGRPCILTGALPSGSLSPSVGSSKIQAECHHASCPSDCPLGLPSSSTHPRLAVDFAASPTLVLMTTIAPNLVLMVSASAWPLVSVSCYSHLPPSALAAEDSSISGPLCSAGARLMVSPALHRLHDCWCV